MDRRVLCAIIATCATMAWAQDNSSIQGQAGCGPNEARFEVKREARRHPAPPSEPGKALVYVYGDSQYDNAGLNIGGLTTRVGLDGEWVGAYKLKSYTYFSVGPGEHHLCTSPQSVLKTAGDSAAITFNAEEGKVYYFRTQPSPASLAQSTTTQVANGEVELAAVDPAQAGLVIQNRTYSISKQKK